MTLTTIEGIFESKTQFTLITGSKPSKILMDKATYNLFYANELSLNPESVMYKDYTSGSILVFGMPIYKSDRSCIL